MVVHKKLGERKCWVAPWKVEEGETKKTPQNWEGRGWTRRIRKMLGGGDKLLLPTQVGERVSDA